MGSGDCEPRGERQLLNSIKMFYFGMACQVLVFGFLIDLEGNSCSPTAFQSFAFSCRQGQRSSWLFDEDSAKRAAGFWSSGEGWGLGKMRGETAGWDGQGAAEKGRLWGFKTC